MAVRAAKDADGPSKMLPAARRITRSIGQNFRAWAMPRIAGGFSAAQNFILDITPRID
jgi:hypothetical protein